MQFFKAPPDVAEAMTARDEPETCEIYPDCHKAVRLFLRLQTQWRTSMKGHLLGLDYPGTHAVMESSGCWPDDTLFEDIQTMEFTAINHDAELSNG